MKRMLVAIVAMALGSAAFAAPAAGKAPEKPAEDWIEPTTGMVFRPIPKGCFKMGAETPQVPQPDPFWERVGFKGTASEDERPVHEACVDAFWLGKHEVRASEWRQVMGGDGGSGDGLPMTQVTWEQAEEFARRLTEASAGKYRFRLPTEAEWEYACRGGARKDIDPLADEVDGAAWFLFVRYDAQPVGQLKPNAFGLHDMLGNVWEWVADSYAPKSYGKHPLFNPQVKTDTGQKVLRGGSFRTERVQVRCAMRGHQSPRVGSDAIGLRLVREK